MKGSLTEAKEGELHAARTGKEKVQAIQCTSCAAPLKIRAGANITTLTCEYCHSVLDMNDNYKVLSKFSNVIRPDSPFKMGMKGKIKGVEWTIIGWITYKTGEFPSEEWSEFFLYSPLYGYGWLVEEGNKLSFSRRVRDFDMLKWKSNPNAVVFYNKGHYHLAEESYTTYIQYVEGEMSWVAQFGDIINCWDYSGASGKGLSIEKSKEELEITLNEKLNPKFIYQSFGITKSGSKHAPHAGDLSNDETNSDDDDGFTSEPVEFTAVVKGYIGLFVVLVAMLLYASISPKDILSLSTIEHNTTTKFKVENDAFLTKIEIDSPFGLKNKSYIKLFQGTKELVYINEYVVKFKDKQMYADWSTKVLSTSIYIQLPKGEYHLRFIQGNTDITNYKLTVQTGVVRLLYIFILLAIIAFLLFKSFLRSKFVLIILGILLAIVLFNYIGFEFIFALVFMVITIYSYINGDHAEGGYSSYNYDSHNFGGFDYD